MTLWEKLPLWGVVLLAAASLGCNKLKARDQLNKGVMSFRNSQFQDAVEHFKKSVQLDPTYLNARLYLATAYFQQYIPGGQSAANLQVAQDAIQTYQQVLNMDPNNETALGSIAELYYNMKNFDKAKAYQRKLMQLEPNNPQPYYWIGVIDWAIAYQNDGEMRKTLKLNIPKPDGSLPPLPPKASAQLADQNGALVNEGIDALQKAIALKPDDFNTMVYINLLYRQKADIDTEKATHKQDLATADNWEQKAMNLRKSPSATPATSGSSSQ